jgi:hypothetical protein
MRHKPERLWGPHLAERTRGTVREDYSAGGTAWEYFGHEHARSLPIAETKMAWAASATASSASAWLALWNGADPILKEHAFGLTGQGGHRAPLFDHRLPAAARRPLLLAARRHAGRRENLSRLS